MRKTILSFAILLIVSSIGCAPKQMYYWGDYSDTLYAYKKNSNDETLLKHMQELNKIIEQSNKHNTRVPPGVYGELGYLTLKSDKVKEAIEYFNIEKQLYPESTILMDRLIKKSEESMQRENEQPDQTTSNAESL
jgi:hypothetical protein